MKNAVDLNSVLTFNASLHSILNSLTKPRTFLLISVCRPLLVSTGAAVVVVGSVVEDSVALAVVMFLPVALLLTTVKESLLLELSVAESGTMLVLMRLLICWIADLVSLNA